MYQISESDPPLIRTEEEQQGDLLLPRRPTVIPMSPEFAFINRQYNLSVNR